MSMAPDPIGAHGLYSHQVEMGDHVIDMMDEKGPGGRWFAECASCEMQVESVSATEVVLLIGVHAQVGSVVVDPAVWMTGLAGTPIVGMRMIGDKTFDTEHPRPPFLPHAGSKGG